jgi:P27 family predicted phage terminase small subunit
VPARKGPPGTQQDRRPQRPRVTALQIAKAQPSIPGAEDCPALPIVAGGLLKATEQAWVAFWTSQAAKAAEQVDRIVAERWILAYDEYRRAMNAFRRQRLTTGSTGQLVLNPLSTWVASREAAMHKAEAQLGIGTKSRADLGISVGQAHMTAHQLNALTQENDHADEAEVDAEEVELLEEFEQAT